MRFGQHAHTMAEMLLPHIERLPDGYSEGLFQGVRYGITKTRFNAGRSFKVHAQALGGTDHISLNCYLTRSGERIRPCEMPMEKVADFLAGVVVLGA